MWWEQQAGVPEFAGIKISQAAEVRRRPAWGIHHVTVFRGTDRLLVGTFGELGWGGNSGFGALNLAVQFGAVRIVLVGMDMRIDKGVHWHGLHKGALTNPNPRNVQRWRRCIDEAAPVLDALGITVVNASPVSALAAYPKMSFSEAIDG